MKKKYFLIFLATNFIFAKFPKITEDSLDLYDNDYKYILSDKIKENSGLQFWQNKLYTFNDSGGENEIYQLDLQGNIQNIISLNNAKNIDWEDITNNKEQFFIGDFGNNSGNRKDLTIYVFNFYKIQKNAENKFEVSTSKIEFEYENQIEFPLDSNLKTDFDCEAMIFYNNKIHIFTKEWISKKTHHYILDPNIKTKQKIVPIEVFDINMMVTGAEIHENILYLIGYTKDWTVELFQFKVNEKSDLFFTNEFKKTYLGFSPSIGQIEAITINSKGLYISGE